MNPENRSNLLLKRLSVSINQINSDIGRYSLGVNPLMK